MLLYVWSVCSSPSSGSKTLPSSLWQFSPGSLYILSILGWIEYIHCLLSLFCFMLSLSLKLTFSVSLQTSIVVYLSTVNGDWFAIFLETVSCLRQWFFLPPHFCFVFLVHLFILWGRISFGPVPGFTTCYVTKDDFQYVISLPPPKCWNFRWAPELTHQNCFLESLSRYLMLSTVTNLLKNQATVGWVGEKKGGKRLQFYCLEGIRT